MRRYVIAGLISGLALVATACGGGESPETTAAAPAATQAPAAGENVAVRLGESALGPVLVGLDGRVLYGFTNDLNGQSTCVGACADAWPPVIVNPDWIVGPNLDSGVFSSVDRPDGTKQLVAGKWPLYYFSGDSTGTDLNGQGSGDVWFIVGPDARLIEDPKPAGAAGAAAQAAATTVALGDTELGGVLVDGEGRTLYAFTKDEAGTPTCAGDCADAWPAALVEGDIVPGAGLDPATFTLVEGVDGGQQLKAGKWPLYRFAGDSAPGDINGQGSGDVWFAVAADGKLIK